MVCCLGIGATLPFTGLTKRSFRVVYIPASYSVGLEFKFWPGDWLVTAGFCGSPDKCRDSKFTSNLATVASFHRHSIIPRHINQTF
jgi:hypothetical protein